MQDLAKSKEGGKCLLGNCKPDIRSLLDCNPALPIDSENVHEVSFGQRLNKDLRNIGRQNGH